MSLYDTLRSRAEVIDDNVRLSELVARTVASGPHDRPIHLLEVDTVVSRYAEWLRHLPRVKPYYAIKCNDTEAVVETLTVLGAGYDCASQPELERVLRLGVPTERIIYAQPSKSVASLKFARDKRIRTVFDNEFELDKIAQHFPDAELLLRYRFDSGNTKINLGSKFGCEVTVEARQLLDRARKMGMNVVGFCFNVGSMSYDAEVFYKALQAGREISDYAASIGFQFRVLDLGGGFVGDKDDSIARYAQYINRGLDEFFPEEWLEVFAEPGRYLCAAAVTNVCVVQGKRYFRNASNWSSIESVGYYLNDGMYGTFYGAKYRGMVPKPIVWKPSAACGPVRPSKLFGPTCDGNDYFMDGVLLPELEPGDTLVFETEGAYASVHSCRFNGFHLPKVVAYIRRTAVELLKQVGDAKMDSRFIDKLLLDSEFLKNIGQKCEPLSFTD
ncbi:ornithine decarboxylase 1-like [Anopheles ziemanni]|uniref:ornithine decarboxylase 1-like n=1 Tax=Anopheles coustani TaxID=139045 RepID=UPI00265B4337|nr:ornithine decarboxylase 1-like [Anopheles coustani]XP_058177749.1 ornithine decarboxylase 1-like [Anopheles ziemanni]